MKNKPRLRWLLLCTITQTFFTSFSFSQTYISSIGPNLIENKIQACSGFYVQQKENMKFGISASLLDMLNEFDKGNIVEFQLYPNPSDGNFQISFLNTGVTDVRIISVEGKELFNARTPENLTNIDQSLAPGNYFVTISNDSGIGKKLLIIK